MIYNLSAAPRPLRRSDQIVHIQHPHPLLLQYIPNMIPHTDRPRRRVPIPSSQPPPRRLCHLRSDRVHLIGRQQSILHFADRGIEVRARVIRIAGCVYCVVAKGTLSPKLL